MGKLIDSSVLIAAERGVLNLRAALADHRSESIAVSAITAAELLHGVHRLHGEKRNVTEAFVEGLLRGLPVLPFDLQVARVHARMWADLKARGRPVGERDLMIAATALARGFEVVTRDERSFPNIPGLPLTRW